MIATSPSAANGIPSNFDLPPIASPLPYVNNQSAVPFSQLLLNTPRPAPPTPQPAPPPPPPPSDKKSATSDQSGTGSQTPENGSQTSAQTDASGNTQQNAGPANTEPASTSAPSSTENTTEAQPPPGNVAQTKSTHTPGEASAAQTGASQRMVDQAAAARSTVNAPAAVAAVATVSTHADKSTKADAANHSKPTSHAADSHVADSPNTPQTDLTTQAAAQSTLLLPVAPTLSGETTVKGQTDGKAKTTAKSGTTNSGAAPPGKGARPSPPLENGGASTALLASAVTTSTDAINPAVAHASLADQSNAAVKNAAALASAPIQAGGIAAPILSAATAAMDTSVPDNAAAAVVQAVETVAASLPHAASTTTDAAATNVASAAQPAGTPGPTVNAANAPQTNSLPAAPTFANSFATNAADGSASDPLSAADRARFVQRVARAFQSVGDQGGQIRLRLSPPELGSLQLDITVKQGALTANIQADNSTAQQALLSSLPELRERLAQQDIRIEHFDVQLAGQSSGGLPQSPQGNSGFDQSGRQLATPRVASVPAGDAATNETTAIVSAVTNGALNVIV